MVNYNTNSLRGGGVAPKRIMFKASIRFNGPALLLAEVNMHPAGRAC